jgi:hypothetical protein
MEGITIVTAKIWHIKRIRRRPAAEPQHLLEKPGQGKLKSTLHSKLGIESMKVGRIDQASLELVARLNPSYHHVAHKPRIETKAIEVESSGYSYEPIQWSVFRNLRHSIRRSGVSEHRD